MSGRVVGRVGVVRLLVGVRGMLRVGVRNRTTKSRRAISSSEAGVNWRGIEVRSKWWWEVIVVARVWDNNSRGIFVMRGWGATVMNGRCIRIKAWLLGGILLLCTATLLPSLLSLEFMGGRVLGKCGRIGRERFGPKIIAVQRFGGTYALRGVQRQQAVDQVQRLRGEVFKNFTNAPLVNLLGLERFPPCQLDRTRPIFFIGSSTKFVRKLQLVNFAPARENGLFGQQLSQDAPD
jgi:hypothetical protein